MLRDSMVSSGQRLFRWRSYLLFAFTPLFLWAVADGETIETGWNATLGEGVEALAVLMVLAGEALRILTVGFVPRGTSGRNTHQGQVAERLNTSGLYSLTRNPLYLANCVMYLGLALFTQHLWVVVVMALSLALYYERIIAAEEDFLRQKFGQAYADWAARTPAFFPRLTGWEKPDLFFSLRTVIRREHASVFGAIAGLYLIEAGLHGFGRSGESMATGWHWIVGLALALDLGVIVIKHRTRLLAAEGR